jgi:hypothetical protein
MKTFKQYVRTTDRKDTVTFDIPLLIRMLEYAREEIKSDPDLHRAVERLINIRNRGVLTMYDYSYIAGIKKNYVREDGGVAVAGPTNVTATSAMAGTGDKGGEPGVNMKKKKGPVLLQDIGKRKPPKM